MQLTEKRRKILEWIAHYVRGNGIAPTIAEIRVAFGLRSQASAHKHVEVLRRDGYLTVPDGKHPRSIELTDKYAKELRKCPMCQRET